jgi:hypothetical protein
LGVRETRRLEALAFLREGVQGIGFGGVDIVVEVVRVGYYCRRRGQFSDSLLLFLACPVVGELVAQDGPGMGDECPNHIFFESESQVKVRPGFVGIF